MGGSRISGKGVQIYVKEGVRFADLISFFLNTHENVKIFSQCETKLFYFHGIFKKNTLIGRGWGSSEPHEPPLDPPLMRLSGYLLFSK